VEVRLWHEFARYVSLIAVEMFIARDRLKILSPFGSGVATSEGRSSF
jgi:SRSO17 transposase